MFVSSETKAQPDKFVKICFFGNSHVGKTSLINFLSKGYFL